MKTALAIGLLIGFVLGSLFAGFWADALFVAQRERHQGHTLYADNLLTVAAAHGLDQDREIWNRIGEWGMSLASRLAEKEAHEQLKELRK